ncbi:J domain-containing protein [Pararhodobacter sp.]|uniref:J domain-containing protein n=1 Tax=Pararhodobacter sp. TaxID=2127056 RepID=UPI002AFDE941|nr:J domain-containing protein [Pararhodobacter sp.]
MQIQDHYSTLQVDRCASAAEIKAAFRILAQRFHPDVSEDRDGERKFKNIAEAYRTLKRPDSRIAYDHQINNYCGHKSALTIDFPNIGNFDWGLAMFQNYLWFWLSHDENPE